MVSHVDRPVVSMGCRGCGRDTLRQDDETGQGPSRKGQKRGDIPDARKCAAPPPNRLLQPPRTRPLPPFSCTVRLSVGIARNPLWPDCSGSQHPPYDPSHRCQVRRLRILTVIFGESPPARTGPSRPGRCPSRPVFASAGPGSSLRLGLPAARFSIEWSHAPVAKSDYLWRLRGDPAAGPRAIR